jgi:exosortase
MARRFSKHGWTPRHLVLAIVMLVIGVCVAFDAWADIAEIAYKDDESSHIFLVPLVVAWLVWVRRGRIRKCQPMPTLIGPALVTVGWALSAFGYHNATQAAWHLGAVLVGVGCVVTVLGRDVLVRFLPAFLVLVFLVPVPGKLRESVAVPLMTATAGVTEFLFDSMGFPIERSGNELRINGERVAIAEACNGLRMVFALVLVSYAFAFGEPLRHYVRLIIIVASPLSAILCNVIRMVPTVWVYGYAKGAAERVHDIGGWVMLGIAFVLLMSIVRVLRWALIPVHHYTLATD